MHRDLKLENLVLKSKHSDVDIILTDFGLSEHVKKHSHLFRKCGTPGYLAPEVLLGEYYDTKADIFSAGIIFYKI